MKRKKHLELLIVLAIVALLGSWFISSDTEEDVLAESTPTPTTATSLPSANRESKPIFSVDGVVLGQTEVAKPPTVVETSADGAATLVRGSSLRKGETHLFSLGASHDEVKAALGPPVGFAHGGRCYGYWRSKSLPDLDMGLLIKFDERGVCEIVLSKDWVPLSTELALTGINGPSSPVDGSDGYKDFKEWSGRSRQ